MKHWSLWAAIVSGLIVIGILVSPCLSKAGELEWGVFLGDADHNGGRVTYLEPMGDTLKLGLEAFIDGKTGGSALIRWNPTPYLAYVASGVGYSENRMVFVEAGLGEYWVRLSREHLDGTRTTCTEAPVAAYSWVPAPSPVCTSQSFARHENFVWFGITGRF